jgi:High potential iron-sulfur protein
MSKVTRREFGRYALVVLAAAPLASACGGGELECSPGSLSADQRTARTALQYLDTGSDPARHCSACMLYTGTATACGTCTVIAGAIHPQGTCNSFVARPS